MTRLSIFNNYATWCSVSPCLSRPVKACINQCMNYRAKKNQLKIRYAGSFLFIYTFMARQQQNLMRLVVKIVLNPCLLGGDLIRRFIDICTRRLVHHH